LGKTPFLPQEMEEFTVWVINKNGKKNQATVEKKFPIPFENAGKIKNLFFGKSQIKIIFVKKIR